MSLKIEFIIQKILKIITHIHNIKVSNNYLHLEIIKHIPYSKINKIQIS